MYKLIALCPRVAGARARGALHVSAPVPDHQGRRWQVQDRRQPDARFRQGKSNDWEPVIMWSKLLTDKFVIINSISKSDLCSLNLLHSCLL